MTHTGVTPTLEELQAFRNHDKTGEEDPAEQDLFGIMGDDAGPKTVTLGQGDTVRVTEGDLQNLMCQILSINHTSQTAKVKPLIQQIQHEVLEFPVAQLVKYVQVGDHVKVTDGRYAGETGTVVNVEEPEEQQFVAIVLTDNSAKEIQVFVRDVRVSTEVATGLDSLGGYEQGDLVMLGMTNVGVIINVGLEDFQVITQAGTLQTVRLQELHGKCNRHSANNVVLDSRTNHIQMNDMVNVEDGPHKGSSGTIKHIHRAYLFLLVDFQS